MLRNTLAPRCELAGPGLEICKGHTTALAAACANATGSHQLPMLETPRCLSMSAMPIVYTSHKGAWMNSTIFMKWFTDFHTLC